MDEKKLMSPAKEVKDGIFYYRTSVNSDRGAQIVKFIEDCKACAKRTSLLAKELGAATYEESPNAVYPGLGIGSLGFYKPQSKRVYRRIGRRKNLLFYIPVCSSTQGKDILNKILKLNLVSVADLRKAFGMKDSASYSPAYFVWDGYVYLSARYEMGEEYEEIDLAMYASMADRRDEALMGDADR